MRSTGITRKVDELGRIVLPIEIRKNLGLEPKTPIEIFVAGDKIILRKYDRGCAYCGESEGTVKINGILVCEKCAREMPGKYKEALKNA